MNTYIRILIIATILFQSCQKKENIGLEMDISIPKTSYKVGEEVRFAISGNPDQLTFYSGQDGNKYEYRNRTVAESKSITLSFSTNRRYGADAQQPNSLRLLASQSFSGDYKGESILSEQWVDITSAFVLSGIQSGDATYVSSGVVDLKSLAALGLQIDPTKVLYFAFKYTGSTGSTQPRWWINQFDLNTITPDDQVLPISNLQGGGWVSIGLNSSPVSWIFNTNGLRHAGGGAAVGSNLVYAVSKGFNLNAVNPDKGTALKNMSTRMDSYAHKYSKPGTYHVVFLGANTNVYGSSQVLKEFTIEVLAQ